MPGRSAGLAYDLQAVKLRSIIPKELHKYTFELIHNLAHTDAGTTIIMMQKWYM